MLIDGIEYKLVPVERSYDMRVRAIIAFNTAEQAGKDRDDALDAAFQAMLAAAPTPPAATAAAQEPVKKEEIADFFLQKLRDFSREYANNDRLADDLRIIAYCMKPLYLAPASPIAAQPQPENIWIGYPFDNPAFEALCREHGIWGTAESALAAVFWRAAQPKGDDARDAQPKASGPGMNAGHGHVWPRPDGVKARCGGPAICAECAIDAAIAAKGE